MVSVTQRIKQVKQPYGGFLKVTDFEANQLKTNEELTKEENIHSGLVGLAVDYLTRFMMGTPIRDAFRISFKGATLIGEVRKADKLASRITGLDDESIISACKIVGYDVVFRAGPLGFKEIDEINPDSNTINNIRIMVKRSISFFEQYGPIVKDGFTFEGGYTRIIDAGDGDFLTKDTLWDFKVSKEKPKTAHTLQLLIYYIMGIHSIHDEFKSVKKLGIYNPRLNTVYLKEVGNIDKEIIDTVSIDIIGYGNSVSQKESDKLLSVTDVMQVLKCSRYRVMKYHTEDNLPLFKIKNKYYIKGQDLLLWVKEMEEKRKRQQAAAVIIGVVVVLITILFCMFFFNGRLFRF